MAAPANVSTAALSGKFIMNSSLSDTDKWDKILGVQGVGWIARKAILNGTIELSIQHYTDDSGVEHIDITQSLSGRTRKEEHLLDWTERQRTQGPGDNAVIGKSHRVPLAEINEDSLKQGWLPDTYEHQCIEIFAQEASANKAWTSRQVWGFQDVGGMRRYARNLHMIGPKGEVITGRLVYDYKGPL